MPDRIVQYGTSPMRMGAAGMSGLTTFEDAPIYHVTPTAQMEEFQGSGDENGNPNAILIGMILALAILWAVRENSAALQREVLGVNIFNFLTVLFMAVVGIWLGKIVFGRFRVPGLTPIFAGI